MKRCAEHGAFAKPLELMGEAWDYLLALSSAALAIEDDDLAIDAANARDVLMAAEEKIREIANAANRHYAPAPDDEFEGLVKEVEAWLRKERET